MPPKKKSKVTESSSSTIFDRSWFVSSVVEEHYRHMVIYWNYILERGFEKLLPENIQSLVWKRFALQPGATLIPLVNEFYANAKNT